MGKRLTAFFESLGDGAKGAEGEEDDAEDDADENKSGEGYDDEREGSEGCSETGWWSECEQDCSVSNEEELEAEDETEKDAPENEVDESRSACRQKEWWKRGDVDAKLNTVNMTAWVHKECDIMDEEALIKLQEAWNNSERKDECIVRLDDPERAFWMGTEVG